jgi:hypothetical protein
VFLGDYLDPHDDTADDLLIDNLKDIIQFKREHSDDVVLLLGNHDIHYFVREANRCTRYDMFIAGKIRQLFVENRPLFQYACQDEKIIYTHAGISHKWFVDDFKGDLNRNIAEQLNNPTDDQLTALYRCGAGRGGERGTIGGIFWADYTELEPPLQGYTQIVGHNKVEEIQEIPVDDASVWFCDCLWKGEYLTIDGGQLVPRLVPEKNETL